MAEFLNRVVDTAEDLRNAWVEYEIGILSEIERTNTAVNELARSAWTSSESAFSTNWRKLQSDLLYLSFFINKTQRQCTLALRYLGSLPSSQDNTDTDRIFSTQQRHLAAALSKSFLKMIKKMSILWHERKSKNEASLDSPENSISGTAKNNMATQYGVGTHELFRPVGKYMPLPHVMSSMSDEAPKTENTSAKQEFQRQSKKYWVHVSSIVPVILVLIEFLPLFTHGANRRLIKAKKDASKDIPEEIQRKDSRSYANPEAQRFFAAAPKVRRLSVEDFGLGICQKVSSLYFENLNTLEIYRTRLEKIDDATLIRIRWYNDDVTKFWLERKIHRTGWIGDRSAKERCCLEANSMLEYLRQRKDSESGPKIEEKYKDENSIFKNEVSEFYFGRQLRPTVESTCGRLAFQYEKIEKCRVSLDVSLGFRLIENSSDNSASEYLSEKIAVSSIGEFEPMLFYSGVDTYVPQPENAAASSSAGSGAFASDTYFDFPYGVLELKLQDDYVRAVPDWINRIFHADNELLLSAQPRFSKYCHGIYGYAFGRGKPDVSHLKTPPHLNNFVTNPVVNNKLNLKAGIRKIDRGGDVVEKSTKTDDKVVTDGSDLFAVLTTADKIEKRMTYLADQYDLTPPVWWSKLFKGQLADPYGWNEPFDSHHNDLLQYLQQMMSENSVAIGMSPVPTPNVSPGNNHAHPRKDMPSGDTAQLIGATLHHQFQQQQQLIPNHNNIRKTNGTSSSSRQKTGLSRMEFLKSLFVNKRDDTSHRSLIVEPKTFFANERTFLQWFNAAIFMGGAGVTTLAIRPKHVAGFALLTLCGLILIYATLIYYWRDWHLRMRIARGYSDQTGPIMLTIATIFTLGLVIGFNLSDRDDKDAVNCNNGVNCSGNNANGTVNPISIR